MSLIQRTLLVLGILGASGNDTVETGHATGKAWVRHTIDDSSRGADGVKLGDFDGDKRLDIVTGWEEGGEIRIYRNPGPTNARQPWPKVTVGRVSSPEDAIPFDIDGDGRLDVISCCEGDTRSVYLHRLRPGSNPQDWLAESSWRTEPIQSTISMQQWMQATILRGKSSATSAQLVLGSKNRDASIGILVPSSADEPAHRTSLRKLADAGWIMSLIAHDMDFDGDEDIVFSDRKGERTGLFWLENPGDDRSLWKTHPIGALNHEVMFADLGDVDGDGQADLAVAVKPREVWLFFRESGEHWRQNRLRFEKAGIGTAKSVKIADINLDGRADLIVTCENADGDAEGIVWLERSPDFRWNTRHLGGPAGTKFDLVETLDLDDDGDLDVITCEEKDGLGVIWYENPTRSPK